MQNGKDEFLVRVVKTWQEALDFLEMDDDCSRIVKIRPTRYKYLEFYLIHLV